MGAAKLLGLVLAFVGLGLGIATAQPATMMNGRLVPYIPHLLPPEAGGPLQSSQGQSLQPQPKIAPARDANICVKFLRSNRDVLRIVSSYANGSARNPNMSAEQTVNFIGSTITQEVRNVADANYFTKNASTYYKCLDHIDRSIIGALWPDLNAVIVRKEKQESIEADTNKRQRESQLQREKEQEAANEERVRKQAAIDVLPSNRLLRSYRLYIDVKQCFDARKGYALVYLNENQMMDAKIRVVAIEKSMKDVDPTIDTDAIWRKANAREADDTPTNEIAAIFQFADAVGRKWVSSPDWIEESHDYCKRSYSSLTDLYNTTGNRNTEIKKDF